MGPFFFAVFGAICWGLAPVFGKVGLRGIKTLDGLAARTSVTVLLLIGWALGSGSFKRIVSFSARTWIFLAAEAFLATFAGDLAYYAAIKKGDIGQAALVLAGSPVLTLLVGCCLLGEKLTPLKVIGAFLITVGIILVGINSIL